MTEIHKFYKRLKGPTGHFSAQKGSNLKCEVVEGRTGSPSDFQQQVGWGTRLLCAPLLPTLCAFETNFWELALARDDCSECDAGAGCDKTEKQ